MLSVASPQAKAFKQVSQNVAAQVSIQAIKSNKALPVLNLKKQAAAFDRGVLTRAPGDTLILAPPFVSSADDIQRMADALRCAIEDTATR